MWYNSLSRKLTWVKCMCFSVSLIIFMKIVNIMCISKKKLSCKYIDLMVKVFEEGWGYHERLKTSKREGSDQNWMVVDRERAWEGGGVKF